MALRAYLFFLGCVAYAKWLGDVAEAVVQTTLDALTIRNH